MCGRLLRVVIVLLALPVLAHGAGPTPPPSGGNPGAGLAPSALTTSPYDFPHPTMPWNGLVRPDVYGQVIRYVQVPPQQVTVTVAGPSAETAPFHLQAQVVTIPGYVFAETTNGYLYPQRWMLEQLNVGVYQWRLRPPEFRLK